MANSTSNLGEGFYPRSGRRPGTSSNTSDKIVSNIISAVLAQMEKSSGSLSSKSGGFSTDVAKETGKVTERLEGEGGGGSKGWARAGTAARFGMGVAAVGYSMLPNVTEAVSQRMTAQGVASMLGNGATAQGLISSSNAMIGDGSTGALSAQMAMGALASTGILPTMGGYQNIMNSTGGLSVLTGMGNEQVAAAFGGINGMNFMRAGVRARDNNGQIRKPEDIANDLYRRMFGGRKLTEAQAAQVFNPNSRGYAGIAQVAGGDPALMSTLQQMVYFQAKGGGQKLDMSDPKKVMDDVLHLAGDDPSRAQFKYNTSQAKVLEATGSGLVGGYSAALGATATVNNAFASLAQSAPAVANAFAKIAGFTDTLPFAGNTGMTMFGLGSQAGGLALQGLNTYMMGKALGNIAGGGAAAAGGGIGGIGGALAGFGRFMGAGVDAAALKGAGALERMGMGGAANKMLNVGAKAGSLASKFGGRLIPGVGAAITAFDTYKVGKNDEHFNWKHFGLAATSGAVTGGLMGGPYGALAGGILGAADYGLSYFFGGDGGSGGWGGDTQSSASHSRATSAQSANSAKTIFQPANGPVSADYGQKPKNNSYWQMLGYHSGRDFAAKKGSPARAYRSGTVVAAGRGVDGEAYGNVVEIDHGGHRSMYAHLDSIGVTKGQQVKAGQQIGNVGETGSGAHGPHLHFEIRQGYGNAKNMVKDPRPYLTGAASGSSIVDKAMHAVAGAVTGAFKRVEGWFAGSNADQEKSTLSGAGSGYQQAADAISTDNRGLHSMEHTTSSLLGFGGDSGAASLSHANCGVKIEMNVNIANSSTQEATRLAQMVKAALDKEMRYSKVGEY